jgi:exopolyphosphatase/guanosine-5'-triphosphate,3'-diphosphate pyrophosphatase
VCGELGTGELLTPADRVAVTEVTLARSQPIRAMVQRHPAAKARVIASGGTVRALARLAVVLHRPLGPHESSSSVQVNQVELPAGQLHQLAERLSTLDLDARLALPGIHARRAPLLPIGAVVLSTLVEHLGLQRLVVSDWGLREGAVIGALSLNTDRNEIPG